VVREHSNAIRGGMELMGRLMQELDAVTTKGNEIAAAIDTTESDEKQRIAAIERSACRPGLRSCATWRNRLGCGFSWNVRPLEYRRPRPQHRVGDRGNERGRIGGSIREDLRILKIPLQAPAKP